MTPLSTYSSFLIIYVNQVGVMEQSKRRTTLSFFQSLELVPIWEVGLGSGECFPFLSDPAFRVGSSDDY